MLEHDCMLREMVLLGGRSHCEGEGKGQRAGQPDGMQGQEGQRVRTDILSSAKMGEWVPREMSFNLIVGVEGIPFAMASMLHISDRR